MNTNEMIGLIIVSLGSIVGLAFTVAKPILDVTKTMTTLNESIKNLTDKFAVFEISNLEAHKRIWSHNEEQDEQLQDHEFRIKLMEERNK